MLSSNYFSKLLPLFFTAFSVVSTVQAKNIDLPVIPNTLSPTANTFSISSENYHQGVDSNCPKITATHDPYTLHSQAEVDTFAERYAACTSVPYLWISGNDIRNLDALSNITQVTGSVVHTKFGIFIGACKDENGNYYDNTQLNSLNGLNKITRVMGDISINDNNALTQVNAFNNLTYIEGMIFVGNNHQLKSADMFKQLTDIQGDVDITNNPQLENFGFSFTKLTHIDGSLILSNEPFSTAPLFMNLSTIQRGLYISNTRLTDLIPLALSSLQRIDKQIDIFNNPVLTNLSGLDNLTTLGEQNKKMFYDLLIGTNPKLTDCSQLSQVYDPSKESRYYFYSEGLPEQCKASFEGQ